MLAAFTKGQGWQEPQVTVLGQQLKGSLEHPSDL